jgi:serine/threonine protein kinase
MHEVHETLSPGAVLRSRYLVIDLLGKGGFSAVYLVQDLQGEERFFALKELITAPKRTSEHFTFEYSLLERLVHPALPRVHDVFDNQEHNRLYMLMDYVEGPNLETLRHIQHEKRFSLPVITAILAPVVDAIEYLHQQNPPIVHRDIKPSNIILPIVEKKTVLVDFGIAKEFDKQGTTSAVRYGSHGYGAPEQYSAGTSTRTDIYGLGATLYTLLTGEIPADAIDRMTLISNDKPDPLKPPSELVPSIPLPASRAIGRAMSINMMQRFATVQEFWQAVQGESGLQPHISEALNSIAVSPSTYVVPGKTGKTSTQPPPAKQVPGRRSKKIFLLPVLLVLLMFVGIGIGASYWGFTVLGKNQVTSSTTSNLTATSQSSTPTPSARPTMVIPNLHLHPSYDGTISDLNANVPSKMILTHMLQNNGLISGSFSGLNMSGVLSGSVDTSKNITFIVTASNGQARLYFTGSVNANGELGGQFFSIDQFNQSIPYDAFGLWSVAPRK